MNGIIANSYILIKYIFYFAKFLLKYTPPIVVLQIKLGYSFFFMSKRPFRIGNGISY